MKKHGYECPVPSETDCRLFREALDGIQPLAPHGRALPSVPRPSPLPRSRWRDERAAMHAALHDPVDWDIDTDATEDMSFLRPGVPRNTLRKLRRGEWVTQAELDLHGLTRAGAKQALVDFLCACRKRDIRCVRIIHGKGLGSLNRQPILKSHVRHWLQQRDDVLAFVQARAVDGGSGALRVLLKSGGGTNG